LGYKEFFEHVIFGQLGKLSLHILILLPKLPLGKVIYWAYPDPAAAGWGENNAFI